MKFKGLVRYRGVLVASFLLLVIVILFALANIGLQSWSLKASLVFQRIDSMGLHYSYDGGLPRSQDLAIWEESLTRGQRGWLESVAGTELSAVRGAVVQADKQKFTTTLAKLKQVTSAESERRARFLRITSAVVCVLALLVYFFGIIPQLLRLTKGEHVKVESKLQVDSILETIPVGLFLLDKSGQIVGMQSASLKQIFALEREIDGSLLDFIAQYKSDSAVNKTKEYLDTLFGDRVEEDVTHNTNPLKKVEVSITHNDGQIERRLLSFKFAPIVEEGEIKHLLGLVTDISREAQLDQQSEVDKEEQEDQFDLFLDMLRLDKDSWASFYNEADATLNSIDRTLKKCAQGNQERQAKLKNITQQVNSIKAGAQALKLRKLESTTLVFETELARVRAGEGTVADDDLLLLLIKLKLVFEELDDTQSVMTRLTEALRMKSSKTDAAPKVSAVSTGAGINHSGSILVSELEDLCSTLAKSRGVRVVLRAFGLGEEQVPDHLRSVIRDTAIQLIRNSIAHGAKPPGERLAQKKPDYMTITASLTQTEQGYTFLLRDDGEGLNHKEILDKAVKQGLIDAQAMPELTSKSLAKLIFHPRFSNKKQSAEGEANEGVGLNAIHKAVRNAGGAMGFAHSPGKRCQFSVRFKR